MTTCECGKPTRDDAYGCDDCANTMSRILGDVPWLKEQLNITATKQRGKKLGSSAGDGDSLPFHEIASNTLRALRNELMTTVRICDEERVPNSSPYDGLPDDTLTAMSRWLLWRVDGLTRNESFTETLRHLESIEATTLRIVDNPPPAHFLGWCNDDGCNGPVYARGDAAEGKCRDCRRAYPTEASRAALEQALDDQLVTAAELARLATYLSLHVPRDTVRKRINSWHVRKRITAHGRNSVGEPQFRYGEVRVMLMQTFGDDSETLRRGA